MHPILLQEPRIVPILDPEFRPAVLGQRAFRSAVRASGRGATLVIALERGDGGIAVHRTEVFPAGSDLAAANLPFAERLVKMLLWQFGGFRIVMDGPLEVVEHIRRQYAPQGPQAFDAALMADVYERPFSVEAAGAQGAPEERESGGNPRGRHLGGCRIGFDAGASDRKVAAVIDGQVVFSEEVPWNPVKECDPEYHRSGIADAFRRAATHMPRVDAIGVSSAGVYIANRVMVASLFRAVPRDVFREKVRDLFLSIRDAEWPGVPLEVVNDGEVAALAGSMSLDDSKVLGVALGSSEAAGYVTAEGNITGWLNELAFSPVDFSPSAAVDEWSGGRGCGGDYFSQKAAIRLAARAGIALDPALTAAEELKRIQGLLARGDPRARNVFQTIGCYMGYGIAAYADLYDLKHVMLMGRVVSGEGGNIILDEALRVLAAEFPELRERIQVHLPGESSRRVGQAVAAASLPWLG